MLFTKISIHNFHGKQSQRIFAFFLISLISLSTSSSVLSGIFPLKKMQPTIMKVAKSIKVTIIRHFFSEVLYYPLERSCVVLSLYFYLFSCHPYSHDSPLLIKYFSPEKKSSVWSGKIIVKRFEITPVPICLSCSLLFLLFLFSLSPRIYAVKREGELHPIILTNGAPCFSNIRIVRTAAIPGHLNIQISQTDKLR